MQTRILKFLFVLALAAVICLPGVATADITMSQAFGTDYGPNAFYLWMDQADPYFAGTSGLPSNWSLFVDEPGREFFATDQTNTANLTYTQKFGSSSSSMPAFSFQWAEVRWDADWATYDLLGAGTCKWNGGWNCSSTTFTHSGDIKSVVIPLPPSALLLGTGLVGLAGLGWRRRKTNV